MKLDDCEYVGDGWRECVESRRSFCDKEGIVFNQAHAPFAFRWEDPKVYEEIAQPRVLRSIEISAMMGVDVIVVHPLHNAE